MEPVTVEICTGTACFVMGGAELLLLGDELEARWQEYGLTRDDIDRAVRIKGKNCTGHCRLPGMRPPFVVIDGVLVGEATIGKIADAILKDVLDLTTGRRDTC